MSEQLDITYYQVVQDRPLPGGGTLKGVGISPAYFDKDRAAETLEMVRDLHPDAYLCRMVLLPDTVTERNEMIADLEAGITPS